MNAYELANELTSYYKDISDEFDGFGYIQESATMLRQQADRIAELEKFNKAILKKGGCDGNICKKYDTHPHKELSDEEISLLKAEIEAHKKTSQLLAQKIIELEESHKK